MSLRRCLRIVLEVGWVLAVDLGVQILNVIVHHVADNEWRGDDEDLRADSSQRIRDALADDVREGALLEGGDLVRDDAAHLGKFSESVTHGDGRFGLS
uniref:Putative secreted protein n=1 Tax=Anopheles triannulatus TaxID=58253 RepID=A0A2M4B0I9_9DIPT